MTASYSISLMIVVVALLSSRELKFVESLNITRYFHDYFDNPDCNSTTCPTICSRYKADCLYPGCSRCWCRYLAATNFVGDGKNGGRCLTDDEVVKDSVPEKSFKLEADDKRNSTQCAKADIALKMNLYCETDLPIQWIRTSNSQFINLKSLECMDSGDPDLIALAPCNLTNAAQKWRCNGARIYPLNGNKELSFLLNGGLYLSSSGADWINATNFCKTSIEYKGCYRFNDASTMRTIGYYDFDYSCKTDCTKTYKVIAPIYIQNTQCSLSWNNSSFLKDDQLWQRVPDAIEGLTLTQNQAFRGVEIKVTRDAYLKWSDTILKLEVECKSNNTREQHCVLIKFYSTDIQPSSTTKNPSSGYVNSARLDIHWLLLLCVCYLFDMWPLFCSSS